MTGPEDNNDCFVVSPIGEIGTETFKRAKNVLDYVIRPAAAAAGLNAVRADDLSQPGSITTQIIQQLLNAKAVVADLTDLNPNVFYELAIRDSFGKAVVLIAEDGTKLPFDLIQQRTIFFDSSDLGSAIPARDKIEAALKDALDEPGASSPVKAAVDLNALRSGNPEERQVAELAEQVARMGRELASMRASATRQFLTSRDVFVGGAAIPLTEAPTSSLVEWVEHEELTDATVTAIRTELARRGVAVPRAEWS